MSDPMQLAKPCLDIGLSTNLGESILSFWQTTVGVPFDHVLKVRRGQRQHRHLLGESVLKINQFDDTLPEAPPSGYTALLIARDGAERHLTDPDGNAVALMPPGTFGIRQIGVRLCVRSLDAHRQFYRDAFGFPEETYPHGTAFRAGDSLILLEQSAEAPDDAAFIGKGWRYITFQIFNTDAEHRRVLGAGGREALAPVTLGTTARISMVRDPDGNWIELSQRASIVGSLE